MDSAGHKAFVEASNTFSTIDTLQRLDCAANHTVLLLADNKDACDFKRMREKDGAHSETCIEGHPLVAKSLR